MWIGTGTRAPTSTAPTGRWSARYGKPDGMISEDLDQNAFFAEADGTVWLGSSRGLIRFQAGDPAGARAAAADRDRRRAARATGRSLDSRAASLLGPDERNFSVSWAGLTFIEPRKVRYKHRMVGPGRPVHRDRADRGAIPGAPERHAIASRSSASPPRGKVSASSGRLRGSWCSPPGGRPSGRGSSGCCSRRRPRRPRSCAGGRGTSRPSAGAWKRPSPRAAPSSPRPTGSCARPLSPTP